MFPHAQPSRCRNCEPVPAQDDGRFGGSRHAINRNGSSAQLRVLVASYPHGGLHEQSEAAAETPSAAAGCRREGERKTDIEADPVHDPTYPPLNTLKPVAPNLWIVDSGPLHAFGMPLPVRMTVVRLYNGDLWLHSPTCFDERLQQDLEALGPIRHLVAPNVAHWTFLKEWQRHCPNALTWATPNLRKRRQVRQSELRLDHDLSDTAPTEWWGEFDQLIVPGGMGFREVAFFHTASRTLILTDLVLNLEPDKLPWLMSPLMRLAGTTAPDGRAPIYLRAVIRLKKSDAARQARKLIGFAPERVVFTHGAWFDRDAAHALTRSLRWLLS